MSVPTTLDDAPHRGPGGLSRRLLVGAAFIVVALLFFYLVLPKIAGLRDTWQRAREGDPWWLGVAAGMELLSYGGYVALFRAIFAGRVARIRWSESVLITFAGVAATRLLAAGGAGGIALTVWALRRAGMRRREVASSMTTFMVLLYAVFFLAVLLTGIGLRTGLLHGQNPVGLTILPAAFAGVVIVVALTASLVPGDLDERWRQKPGWWPAWLLVRVGALAATVSDGVSGALRLVKARRPGVLGAVAWWAFDVATLWAAFHAFGDPPPIGVLVMGYFVGQLANVLPLPGGVGGVEGGMIGAFAAFGVDAGLALVAVLAYRAFAFWLPTVPGAVAYYKLTRIVRGWGEAPETDEEPVATT